MEQTKNLKLSLGQTARRRVRKILPDMSPVKESVFRDMMRILVWFPLRWFIRTMPPGIGLKTLLFMGDCHYFLGQGKKRLIQANYERLRDLNGPAELGKWTRQYFRNYYLDRMFIWIFPKFNPENILNYVEISGLEHIDGVMAQDRGVVLVHGHFGPIHLPLVALSLLNYPMKQVGNLSDKGLSWIGRNVAFRLRKKYEQRIPAEIFQAGNYLRPILRWLQQKNILMITGDGTGTKELIGRHTKLKFQGHWVNFPIGPYLLSEKTGAAVLPMFVVPGKNRMFRIVIEPPMPQDLKNGTLPADLAAQFADLLSRYIDETPGYMHFIDRFHPGGLIEPEERNPGTRVRSK